jgi:hypothetical protein
LRRGSSPLSPLCSPAQGHRAVTCLSRCASARLASGRFDPSSKPSYHEIDIPRPIGAGSLRATAGGSGLSQESAACGPESAAWRPVSSSIGAKCAWKAKR